MCRDRPEPVGPAGAPRRWWVAVPDLPAAQAAADAVAARCGRRGCEPVLARYPSGRTWLLGCYPRDLVDVVAHGTTNVVVLGTRGRSAAELCDGEAATRDGELERLVRQPGVAYVIAALPGELRAYGDALGVRPLAWARRDGLVLLASHSRLLRFGAGVDDGWLAARLLQPVAPRVLTDTRSAFLGVSLVRPGWMVAVRGGSSVVTRRWWSPPEDPDLPLARAGALLRDGLAAAVTTAAGRMRGAGSVSVSVADLPSLAVAAVCGAVLSDVGVLHLCVPANPVVDVGLYARIAAGLQPHADHQRIWAGDVPFGADLHRLPALDEPPRFALSVARLAEVVRRAREWGAGAHLSGGGGRQVLLAPGAYLRRAWSEPDRDRQLRGWAFAHGMATGALRARLDAQPGRYGEWLHALARSLADEPQPLATGWEEESRLPVWVTAAGRDAVRDLLDAAARTAEPLAGSPAQHMAVAGLHNAARQAALATDATMALGDVPTEFPYLQQAVAEVCLATVPEQRTDPWRPMPLLTAALPHLPPAEMERHRRGPTVDAVAGLRANRSALADLLDGSLLAERGLVDAALLRPVLDQPWLHESSVAALVGTLATEAWLRTL